MQINSNTSNTFDLPVNWHKTEAEFRFYICVKFFRNTIKSVFIDVLSTNKDFERIQLSYDATNGGWMGLDMGFIIDNRNAVLVYPSIMGTKYCKVHKVQTTMILPPKGAKRFGLAEMGSDLEFKWFLE